MRAHITHRLAGTSLPVDPVGEAERDIPPNAMHVWFKMPLRPAAVLLPLFDHDDTVSLLLTERTHDLPEHPGQVAFPGGRADPGDTDLQFTALRESQEEIGLAPDAVDVVGYVRTQPVISGYAVVPVVGFINRAFTPVLDEREVGAIFEVPLSFFMDESNCKTLTRERDGVTVSVWEYWWDDHRIWGATAKIIREFLKVIR